jgi:hypothetical protein
MQGKHLQLLPQTTLIKVPELGLFTLVHNSTYRNLSSLFLEERRRVPKEDTTTLAYGIIGAYPNSIMWVPKAQLSDFVARIEKMAGERDYQALRNDYGIRRSHPDFWAASDQIHAWYHRTMPEDAALLDYNRLENR